MLNEHLPRLVSNTVRQGGMWLMRSGILVALVAFVAAIVVVTIALRLSTSDSVLAADEAMAIDCDASTSGVIDTDCSYAVGQTFTISVHATNAGDGYAGYQVKPRWTDAILDYLPAADFATENQCAVNCIAARVDNQPDDPSVIFGCASFPVLVTSTDTGARVMPATRCKPAG